MPILDIYGELIEYEKEYKVGFKLKQTKRDTYKKTPSTQRSKEAIEREAEKYK